MGIENAVLYKHMTAVEGVTIRPFMGSNVMLSGASSSCLAKTPTEKPKDILFIGKQGKTQIQGILVSLSDEAVEAGYEFIGLNT